jgi:transposase-like protein
MERRKFSREFKLEAVNLVRDRGVTVVYTARRTNTQVIRRCSNL